MTARESTGRRIAWAATLIMLGNILSRVLGLVREQTIAGLFGTTAAASIFSAANRVPTMVYDLLIGGAITAALVPVFSEYAARDEQRRESGGTAAGDELGTLAGTVLTLALAVLVPAVAILTLFAGPLMALLGVGFAPDIQAQGVALVRLALPSVALLGLSGVLMGVLYALHRVTLPSLSAAVYNAGIILCAIWFSRDLGVSSLVIGVLAGAAGQLALQFFGARGVRLRLSLNVKHPGVRRIMRLYAPVAAGLGVSAVVVTLDTRLASQTGEGSLAAMRYATTLVQLPLGLVATALSFASLPVLSRLASNGSQDEAFKRTVIFGLKASTLLIVPATVALMLLHEPVVRLVFQRGQMDDAGAALTGTALLWYAPQLPFVAADQLLIATFYALQNTRLPVLIGVVCAGIYTVCALGTVNTWGMPGLVLANTLQNSTHAVILLVALWRVSGGLRGFGAGTGLARIVAAGAVMALTLWGMMALVTIPRGTVPLLIYLAIAGMAGGSSYIAALALLRSEELRAVASIIDRRRKAAGIKVEVNG